MMARTTRGTYTQGTVGPVPTATEPTDPVPLEQAGQSGIGSILQVTKWEIIPVAQRASQHFWNWRFMPASALNQSVVPGQMRLKGIRWANNGFVLEVYKNGSRVATIGPNSWKTFNILFAANDKLTFRVGPESTGYAYSAIVYYTPEWLPTSPQTEPRTQAVPDPIAEVLAPIPQIEQPLAAAAPIAAKGSNRFASWIRRRFR